MLADADNLSALHESCCARLFSYFDYSSRTTQLEVNATIRADIQINLSDILIENVSYFRITKINLQFNRHSCLMFNRMVI